MGKIHVAPIRKTTILCLIVVLGPALFISTGKVTAQDLYPVEKIHALQLPSLSGEVKVLYSEGYGERAAYLQDLLQGAWHYLQKPEIIGVKLDLTLVVIDSEDWAKLTRLPYGTSHILALEISPMAVLPATKITELNAPMLAYKDDLSEKTLKRLQKLGVSYEDAVGTFGDLIGFHEIGHIFAYKYGVFTWPSTKWLNELIATYLAYAFLKENRLELAEMWDMVTEVWVARSVHKHSTLADFEKLYIGVGGENYGWYQGKFNQKVSEVYEKLGISFMHALKQSLGNNPKASDGDPFRLQELDVIYKGFTTWAQGPDGDLK